MPTIKQTGRIEKIHRQHPLDSGGDVIEFILNSGDEKFSNTFVVTAFSKHKPDAYGIEEKVGYNVEAECYLNGKSRKTDRGQEVYSNQLNLKSIKLL